MLGSVQCECVSQWLVADSRKQKYHASDWSRETIQSEANLKMQSCAITINATEVLGRSYRCLIYFTV